MQLDIFCRRILITIFSFMLLCFASAHAVADDSYPAFFPGEKLKFRLKWGILPAGEAVLEVLPIETINGVKSFHFMMQVKTNSFIDKIYKYRSRIDAYADLGMTRSLKYLKKTEAGKAVKEVNVQFDWEKKEARYFRTKTKFGPNPKTHYRKRRTPLMSGSFDPLSVFYYTRLLNISQRRPIERPVTDGKDCVVARAEIIKCESIKINGKSYNTFLVQPDLKHVEGVFSKRKDAKIHIWVTADERRIPVKIKSKIFVGSITGELDSVEGPESMTVAMSDLGI
jgi:hypothetical protein